ncbi:aKG-HExxH-type peptide beta-hydroxylase [Streptomyces sp. NBC_00645]|uniref:aKG-HExxH-type peptide beta-hydroxylase n=2 Tax=Streptomyces TaxID=1883 RepID=UPI00324A3F70
MPADLSAATEGWSPLPELGLAGLGGRRAAVLDHLSPYRDFRALRDPSDLPPMVVPRWRFLLAEADELLRQTDPVAHRVVARSVRSVVPVEGVGALRVVSASVPNAFGAVTMSLPDDALSLAATLVHEVQHQLLTAVGDLVPLLAPTEQSPEPRYFAPWRSDARPLRGLLFGAHAFAAVASFWRGCRRSKGERADFEFAVHRWQVRTALAALCNASGLTEAGGIVVQSLAELARGWSAEPVDGQAGELAELCCRDQSASWRAAHLVVDGGRADDLAQRWLAGRPAPSNLPPSRMAAPRTAPRADARTWLARLWITDQHAFKQVWAELDAGGVHPLGIVGATAADAALIAGDTRGALVSYREGAPALTAWIGMGLAGGTRVALLVERPELVLALHTALGRRGAQSPGPEALAEWLGSGPTSTT